jgi:hypothetical protein
MDPDSLDRYNWIPEPDKARLRALMQKWSAQGRGFIFAAVPPAPGRDGFTIFQPCRAPGEEKD